MRRPSRTYGDRSTPTLAAHQRRDHRRRLRRCYRASRATHRQSYSSRSLPPSAAFSARCSRPLGTTVQSIQRLRKRASAGTASRIFIAGPRRVTVLHRVRRESGSEDHRDVAEIVRPVAVASADVTSGPPPLLVQFSPPRAASDRTATSIAPSRNFGDGSATSALARAHRINSR